MAWIIIDEHGEPLTDHDGTLILVDGEAAAREWLVNSDQRVEQFDRWMERKREVRCGPGF